MILLDTSPYMRNGDYIPTRLEAMQDAANMLVGAKLQSHPESTVGVADGTRLLTSPTDQPGPLLHVIHKIEQDRTPNEGNITTAAVQVASLALKHRSNKHGSQRIILFCGTPLQEETKALQKAGRLLKKNNVCLDVILLGELEANEAKAKELVDAANGSATAERTCHLVTIPVGVLPSDVLAHSPILAADGGAYAAAMGAAAAGAFNAGEGAEGTGGAPGGDFVDPNMDPELAMALRVSMEEERARQERASSAAANEESKDDGDAAMPQATVADSEDALLQQALQMSMQEQQPDDSTEQPVAEPEEMTEEAAMQMALQMSMQTEGGGGEFQDPAFAQQMMGKKDDDKKDGDKKE